MHESYDLDFIKFEQTLFKIHFRAKLWQRARLYYLWDVSAKGLKTRFFF